MNKDEVEVETLIKANPLCVKEDSTNVELLSDILDIFEMTGKIKTVWTTKEKIHKWIENDVYDWIEDTFYNEGYEGQAEDFIERLSPSSVKKFVEELNATSEVTPFYEGDKKIIGIEEYLDKINRRKNT